MNCLSVLCTAYQFDKYNRYVTNPWCCIIQCLLWIKNSVIKWPPVFNVSPYLTSLLLAACESATVRYTTWRCTRSEVISRSSFLLLLGRCWFSVVSPGRFIPDSLWIVSCLGSVPYWHDLIVFVRLRTRAARLYCFSVPTIVTRTLLFATLTSALHLFFSNIQTQQLIHDLNIPHTKEQHAAVKYSFGWITWVLGKLLCCRYYRSCAVGITEAVLSVLQKLWCRYYGSCTVGIT